MREIDELRTLSAGCLLTIWRESKEVAEDPLERVLLCNATVLAKSCFCQGEAVFKDAQDVLDLLTGRQMETLLRQLAEEKRPMVENQNPSFDQSRFMELMER